MTEFTMADKASDTVHENPLVNQLLANRGINDAEKAATFLSPDYDAHRHDPFLMPDMEVAVERILRAIVKGERIAIFADYDCDGIPGAVVLSDFFTTIEFTNFTTYIPHRHFEGFGLSAGAVEKLADDKVDLIITIDCGTGNHDVVATANEKGIDVIITDHHEPKDTLPEAVAVVNPKVGDSYPFKELCGAGVIFKVVEALIERGDFEVTPGQAKWFLDMVGIATINDMVPLVDENRVFAYYGLMVLKKSRRPGLQQLFKKAKASQLHLTEDDVGFTIGPRVNAASRMDTPEDAFIMLSTKDEGEAGARVEHLEKLNNERKGLVAAMTKELNQRVARMDELPPVLLLGNPAWRPALVGLTANKLAEEHNRPVFIWGRDGNGVIKGSCRSDGKTSLITLMEAVQGEFLEYGGHHFSGGFAVSEDSIFTLADALSDAFVSLGEKAAVPRDHFVDSELRLSEVDYRLTNTLRQLAPYGTGNPKPLFIFKSVTPEEVAMFGKTKEHLKLTFIENGKKLEALAFFATPPSFSVEPKVGKKLSLLAHVEESFFMGRMQTRLRIIDII